MQLFFESHPDIQMLRGKVYWFQSKPTLRAGSVLAGDRPVDALGVSMFGSVLRDGGRYRMWYQAWPSDWDGTDTANVGHAESDDGIVWRKPKVGLISHQGSTDNNLCDLGVHCPAVMIDPDAPPTHRYRATGCTHAKAQGAHRAATSKGYYTAHSADGLHWHLDSNKPAWPWSDVITSIYHPGRRCALVALKRQPFYNGFMRRSIWEATGRDGVWSNATCALQPDDFDDAASMAMGYRSADFYGMGMLPVDQATVGFVWVFRHRAPVAMPGAALFGEVDVTLAYQHGPGDRWIHAPGRKNFIDHNDHELTYGGLYTASNVVDVGDNEQRLYFCGTNHSHGWHLDGQWKVIDKYAAHLREEGFGKISYASWTKNRLFGFRSDPEGGIDLDLGELRGPVRFHLNYTTHSTGSIRAELVGQQYRDRRPIPGRTLDDSVVARGDSHDQTLRWKDGDVIHPLEGYPIRLRLHMERASVYAFDVRPV